MSRVILLWSGGKDAMQALCHAREQGHQVVALVTFAPLRPAFSLIPCHWYAVRPRRWACPISWLP